MKGEVALRDFQQLKELMERQWGEPVRFDPGMWTLCSERARGLILRKDYPELIELYHHMAAYLNHEGKDSFCVLEEAARAQLLHFRDRDGTEKVKIRCAEDACPACGTLKGAVFLIEEALDDSPLPHRDCSHQMRNGDGVVFCRCRYVAAGEAT